MDGLPLMLVVVPVAVVGVPHLLSAPKQDQIELLQALDRWVRQEYERWGRFVRDNKIQLED